MEGGVRQSRTSSRYAPSPSPAAFNGPVRKWKKQWVTTPSSVPNNGKGNRNNASPPLLLCRWTPVSASAADDQPPTRRFRYTPVVPIVKGNKKAPKNFSTTSTSIRNQSNNYNNGAHMTSNSDAMLGKPNSGDLTPPEEADEQEVNEDPNNSEGHGYASEKRRKLMSPIVAAKW